MSDRGYSTEHAAALVEAASHFLTRSGVRRVAVAAMTDAHVSALKSWPDTIAVSCIIIPDAVVPSSIPAGVRGGHLASHTHDWSLPRGARVLVWLGLLRTLSIRMIARALAAGYTRLVAVEDGVFVARTTIGLLAEKLRRRAKPAPLLTTGMERLGDLSDGDEVTASAVGAGDGVLMVTSTLGAGGAERQVVNTVLALAERGQRTSVLRLRDARDGDPRADFFLSDLQAAGIDTFAAAEVASETFDHFEVSSSAATALFGLGDDRSERTRHIVGALLEILPDNVLHDALRIRAFLRDHAFAVVHTWQDTVNIAGGLASILDGRPRLVMSTRSVRPTNFAYFWPGMDAAYRVLMANHHVAVINNSRTGARDYAAWLGVANDRLSVVYNGVTCAGLGTVECDRPADGPVIGTVFRFSPEKRPALWVEVARLVHARCPSARFVIIGDGPLRKEIEDAVARLGLSHAFTFTGEINPALNEVRLFDIFLLTSRDEGLPNVLIEAQMVGVPVVTTDAGGAKETLVDEELSLLSLKDKPDAIAERIFVLLDRRPDDEKRIRLADAARARFSIASMVEQTLAAYGWAPAPHGQRGGRGNNACTKRGRNNSGSVNQVPSPQPDTACS